MNVHKISVAHTPTVLLCTIDCICVHVGTEVVVLGCSRSQYQWLHVLYGEQ